MTNYSEHIHGSIGNTVERLGGVLRCDVCLSEQPLGDVGMRLAHGWPEHCNQTMRWVTQRQLNEERGNPE